MSVFRFTVLLFVGFGWLLPRAGAQVVADFTANPASLQGCAPLIVNFTDASTGAPDQLEWDLGLGGAPVLNNPTPTQIYPLPGTYTVRLIASKAGIPDTVSKVVTVFGKPTPDFTAGPASVCQGQPQNFTDASTPAAGAAIATYVWDFGDGTNGTGAAPTHTYPLAGNYSVRLTVTDINGCSDFIEKVNLLEVRALPTPSFTFSPSPAFSCNPPYLVNFTSTSTGVAPLSYSWTFGDGNFGFAQNPTHNYTTQGLFDVNLNVLAGNGCDATVTVPEAVRVGLSTADFTANQTNVCVNEAITITPLNTGGLSNVQFDYGDGSPLTTDLTHIYTSPGTYAVSMTSTKAPPPFPPCTSTLTKPNYITVSGPAAPDFDYTPKASCTLPVNVNFTYTGAGGGAYLWDFGDGTTGSGANPTHTYTTAGPHFVSLTVGSGGCDTTLLDTIDLTPVVEIEANNLKGCGWPADVEFSFSANIPGPYTVINWDFDDDFAFSTLLMPVHTFDTSGFYGVSLQLQTAACNLFTTKGTIIYDSTFAVFKDTLLTLCTAEKLVIQNESENANEYIWYANGDSINNTEDLEWQFADTGFYDIKLKVINGPCEDSLEFANYVKVEGPIASGAILGQSLPYIICEVPKTLDFQDNSKNASSILWDFNDGTTSPLPNPSKNYPVAGAFSVRLIATEAVSGCKDTADLPIFLEAEPDLQYALSNDKGCSPFTVQVIDTTPGAVSWLWDFGDGTVLAGDTVLHVYNTPGTYDFKATITTNAGCTKDTTEVGRVQVSNITAQFNFGGSLCAPDPVLFTDLSTVVGGSIVSWNWDFGDGTTSTLQNPTHIYASNGEYTVTLTVSDAIGCTQTNAQVVKYGPGNLAFAAIDSFSCVLGQPTVFTNNTPTAGNTFLWKFGDGATSTAINPTHTYAALGNYDVTLVATRTLDGCVDSLVKPVEIFDPSVDFTSTTTTAACPPFSVNFTSVVSPDVTGYLWDFGDTVTGAISTQPNPSYTYTRPGTYEVKLVVTSSGGCQDSVIKTGFITVGGPTGSFTTNVAGGCTVDTVKFTATGTNISSVQWFFGDGTSQTTAGLTTDHLYSTPGSYTPIALLEDAGGCSVDYTLPSPIILNGVELLQGDTTLCPGTSVSLPLNIVGSPTSRTWNPTTGLTGLATLSPTATPTATTQYFVTVEFGGLCTVVDSVTIAVLPNLAGNAGPDDVLCGTTAILQADPIPPGVTGVWSFIGPGGGASIASPTNDTTQLTGLTPGVYTLQWAIEAGGGACTDTDTVQITVTPDILPQLAQDDSACLNGSAAIVLQGSEIGVTYQLETLAGAAIGAPVAGTGGPLSFPVSPVTATVQYNITGQNAACNAAVATAEVKLIASPVSNAGNDTSICGTNVVLNGNLPPVGSTGSWSILSASQPLASESFSNANLANTAFQNLQAGVSYELQWAVDNGKCTSNDTVVVVVAPNPAGVVATSAAVCAPDGPVAVVASPELGVTYQLLDDFGAPVGPALMASGGALNFPVPSLAPGNYTYSLTGTVAGCPAQVVAPAIALTVLEVPSANAGTDQATCGTSVLMAATPAGSGETGTWEILSGTQPLLTETFSNPNAATSAFQNLQGNTVYELIWVVSNGACSDTDTVSISTSAAPGLQLAVSDTLCDVATASIQLLGSQTGFTYSLTTLWGAAIPGSDVLGTGNPIALPAGPLSPGVNNFRVIANGSGCPLEVITDSVAITLLQTPNLTGTVAPSLTCVGEPITFTSTTSGGSPITNRSLDWGDGTVLPLTLDSATHAYALAGSFTVQLTVDVSSDGSCRAQLPVPVGVEILPAPVADFSLSPASTALDESQTASIVALNATQPNPGSYVYTWSFPESTATAENPAPFTVTQPGNYSVVLDVLDPATGCASSHEEPLEVLPYESPVPGLSISNIFTPNGDGVNDRFEVLLPNAVNLTVSIRDRWGREVSRLGLNQAWDGGNEPEGTYLYYLEATLDNGTTVTRMGNLTLLR